MAEYTWRILLVSITNHSAKALRRDGDPGRRMKTAYANTICASVSTTGKRRAATFCRLKFCSPEAQDPAGRAPGAGAGGGGEPARAVGSPETVCPFSTREQPGWAMIMEPSCAVMPSK